MSCREELTQPRVVIRDDKASLVFNGVDDYVTTTVTIHETLGSIRTKFLLREHKNYNTIFENAADQDDWELFGRSSGVVNFRTNGNIFISSGVLVLNRWYDCVITWNGTAMKMYMDGLLVATGTSLASDITPTYLILGGDANSSINGNISEAQMWSNKELTASEVSDSYYNNIIPTEGLVLKLPMNEGAGDKANDTSGNGNDGTITGATWSSDTPSKARVAISQPRTVATGRTAIVC